MLYTSVVPTSATSLLLAETSPQMYKWVVIGLFVSKLTQLDTLISKA